MVGELEKYDIKVAALQEMKWLGSNVYNCLGRQNGSADALSRCPQAPLLTTGVGQVEFQVPAMGTEVADPVVDIQTTSNRRTLTCKRLQISWRRVLL